MREWKSEIVSAREWESENVLESESVRERGAPEKDGEIGSENEREKDRAWERGRVERNR